MGSRETRPRAGEVFIETPLNIGSNAGIVNGTGATLAFNEI